MLIFISGSINSGKTTTARILAKRIGAANVNVDDLNDTIPNFDLAKDLDKSMDLAIKKINEYHSAGKDIVANYVVREKDYLRFEKEVLATPLFVITLAPRLDIVQNQRGSRILSDWEKTRIQYHYDTGIASPYFGIIIDNSVLTAEQTVDRIVDIIKL